MSEKSTAAFIRVLYWYYVADDRERAAWALRNALLDAGPCA